MGALELGVDPALALARFADLARAFILEANDRTGDSVVVPILKGRTPGS